MGGCFSHLRREFIRKQWRGIAFGGLAGSVISIGVHLLTRDPQFLSVWRQKRFNFANNNYFDGVQAYKAELVALCLSILVIAAVPTYLRLRRYIRSWWAGITSFSIPVTACVIFIALEYGPSYPKTIAAVGSTFLIAICVTEFWRQRSEPPEQSVTDLNIPTANRGALGTHLWQPRTSDDPIRDWEEDIIGRGPVVQLLALHAFSLKSPIVALIGGLGDGKSSVLNLFRKSIEGQAIVVSFSAWLPDSEATLATDLFHDIAAECAKHVHVPQLRKRALTFARMVSASVPYLAGVRGELFRPESQREEIQGLREVLARVPRRIVVLLDEIDRMQKEELLVLLKILRGASSIPNVTFVCAFSEEEIKRVLKDGAISWEYLEKFFPVSVRLSAPDGGWLGTSFQTRLKESMLSGTWFNTDQEAKKFAELLEQIWRDSLSKVCMNLRKAGMLWYDIITAGRSIVRDVDPLDLTLIQALRRYYPSVFQLIRTARALLTYGGTSLIKGEYFIDEKKQRNNFMENLNAEIAKSPEPAAAEILLSWLFPAYVPPSGQQRSFYAAARGTNEDIAEIEKRICSYDHFPMYFTGALPEEMFSQAELERVLKDLKKTETDAAVETVFNRTLDSTPPKRPKREDFLWKLSRQLNQLDEVTTERLAFAVAKRAADFAYDLMNVGEAAQALNIVFAAAQKLSSTPRAQGALEGAMVRAADDTFAIRLLHFAEQKDRNKILTNFSNINPPGLREVFINRMRQKYGPASHIETVHLAQADWFAFRTWVDNSDKDRRMERDFWRRFIGPSRKRLAQAINVIFPANVAWEEGPLQAVNRLFDTDECARLLRELPKDAQLEDSETRAITRMQELLGEGAVKSNTTSTIAKNSAT